MFCALAISGLVTGFFLANIYFYPPSLSRIKYIESLQGLPTEMYLEHQNHDSTSPSFDNWIFTMTVFAIAISLSLIFVWFALSWTQTIKKKKSAHQNFTKRKINLSLIYFVSL